MPVIAYREGKWQPVEWQSSKDLTIAPGAHALHYGSECFEGLKAFRQASGKIVMFRPTANIARMHKVRIFCTCRALKLRLIWML